MDILVNSIPKHLTSTPPVRPTTPGHNTSVFATGQTLTGHVLEVWPGEGSLVNFNGQNVLLNLTQNVVKGQGLTVIVEQGAPNLVFRVTSPAHLVQAPLAQAQAVSTPTIEGPRTVPVRTVPDPPPLVQAHPVTALTSEGMISAASLKSYLNAKQPFGDMAAALAHTLNQTPLRHQLDPSLLQRLEDTLQVLLPPKTSLPDASGLREQVERSGINYEAHVKHVLINESLAPDEQAKLTNDFKGQLLELEQLLGRLDSNDSARTDLLRQVQRGIQNIELQQLSNVFAHEEHQPILLQLTHPMFAVAQTAQLYVRNNASQQQSQPQGRQDYTLVFLLDFTELGALRVDASVRDSQVQATINVEQPAAADFVASHLSDLTARLHDLGFQAHVDCCTHDKITREVDDTLTRLPIPEASRLVDIRA